MSPFPHPLQGRLPRKSIKALERVALPGRLEFELTGTGCYPTTPLPSPHKCDLSVQFALFYVAWVFFAVFIKMSHCKQNFLCRLLFLLGAVKPHAERAQEC